MRDQPLVNGYNSKSPTHRKRADKDRGSVDMPNELGVKLPPLSQVDCLGLHRVDVDAITRERDEKMARLRVRHKRISTGPVKEREFGFGRRKKKNRDVLDGKAPPISQIGMGSQFEVPLWQHREPQRNINATRLLPLSQVSCLTYSPEKEHPLVQKEKRNFRARFEIHESDSEYVKLAKAGGQPGLLHYIEATPPLKRTLDNDYNPSFNGTLPELKSKSVQDPTWKPSQWAALSPIRKRDHHDDFSDDIK